MILRAACTAIVNATQQPDDGVAHDVDRKSSSTGKHSRKDSRQKPLEDAALAHPTKYTYRPDTALQDLFPATGAERKLMQAQQVQTKPSFPRRSESLQPKDRATDKSAAARASSEDHASDLEVANSLERPKTAPIAESSDVSVSTPVSASTDRMLNHTSTALTTAAVTPSRPSERGSQQFVADGDQHQATVEQADAAAVEWMRRELEKRRQRQDRETQAAQASQAMQRAPSRTGGGRGRSLSNGIREYIRPRTASNSRPASRSGGQGSESTGVSRTPSTSGWRSWSLQRKPSKTSIKDARVDPSSSSQSDLRAGKKDVDLNRPLPALPSLETWKDPASKMITGTHIANLMRPKSSKEKEAPKEAAQARVVNIQKVKVVPQSLPKLKTEPSTIPLVPPKPRYETVAGEDSPPSTKSHRVASHSKSSSQDSCFTPASSVYPSKRSIDLVKAAERARSRSQENMSGRPRKDSTTSSYTLPQQAQAPSITPAPRKVSFSTASGTASGTAPLPRTSSSRPATSVGAAATTTAADNKPNFSRKFSSDFHSGSGRPYDPRHTNVGEITALPPMPPKTKKSLVGLRRIMSQFTLGRDGGATAAKKKDQVWMEYVGRDGLAGAQGVTKGGATGEGEGPTVVRF